MQTLPAILRGLSEIAHGYDALVCDVWGVLHDGRSPRAPAFEALRAFRRECGPAILLSNAPRPVAALERQFARIGVPLDCYDAIVTSGVAVREELQRRAAGGRLPIFHIGPERDRGVFEGVQVDCVEAERAAVALCTGLFDDDTEMPEDYRGRLAELKRRRLVLLCANPDIVVQRGGTLVYCAGALAKLYEEMGGEVVYFGKPHAPVYAAALGAAQRIAGRPIRRPLAVGDGLETDIRGANGAGIDAVFIADGIHGEQLGELTPASVAAMCAQAGVTAKAAMHALVW